MRLVINIPGVLGGARARSHAGHESIEMLSSKPVTLEGIRICYVAEPDRRAREQPALVVRHDLAANFCEWTDETNYIMTALNERPQRCAANGSGRAEQKDTARSRRD